MADTALESNGLPRGGGRLVATPPLVELEHVSAGYGPFRALFDVSFAIQPGSVTALLGSNGSGKTTLARVVSGLVEPTAGRLRFDGVDAASPAWQLARRGIAHVPEGRSVFGTLTVEENLTLSFRQLGGRSAVQPSLQQAYELFPILAQRRTQVASTLSGGQQRMLALARVFPDPPRLLIGDELSLGLAPLIVDEVFDALRRLRDAGTALLIVEQHVERALALADEVVLMQQGRVAFAGPKADVGDALEQVLPLAPG